jgi:hypothetical protein
MNARKRDPSTNAFARMTAALKAPSAAVADAAKPVPEKKAPVKAPAHKASTRRNTKIVAGHFAEPMHRALRIAGAEERLTMQEILEEALNDWLVKKGATKHLNK